MEKDLAFVLCQLFVSWIIFSDVLCVKGEVIIDPPAGIRPDGDLVVDAGSTFTLTCRGDLPVTWAYNDYDDENKSKKMIKNGKEHSQEIATLTVEQAYYLDTGYFTCYPVREGPSSPPSKKIYVFVRDPDRFLAVNETSPMILPVQQFGDVQLPCRPTDPDLTVQLMKDSEVFSTAAYDPHEGFVISITSVQGSGDYQCVVNGYEFNIYLDVIINRQSSSLEQPKVSIVPRVTFVGENVTFVCSIGGCSGRTIHFKWTVRDSQLKEEPIEPCKSQLTLTNVSKEDAKEYTCVVTDDSGNHNSTSVTLTVLPPGTSTLLIRGMRYEVFDNGSHIPVIPGQKEVIIVVDIVNLPTGKYIQWYDNDMKPIYENGDHLIVYTNPNLTKLTLNHPSVRDSGTYTLKAGSNSVSVTLMVQGQPELIVNEGKDQAFYMINKSYTIYCDVFALPEPNITWNFKPCTENLSCSGDFSMVRENQQNSTENFARYKSKVVIADQTGVLECRACNRLGCGSRNTTILITDVEDGMAIEKPELVVVSDNVTLSCGVSKYISSESPEWLKLDHGTPSPVKDLKNQCGETKYSYFNKLLFPSVNKNHSGVYICSTKRSHYQKSITLDVKDLELPKINKTDEGTRSIPTGEPVTLHCQVQGCPPPSITWLVNGEMLKDKDKNIKLSYNNQTLSIGGVGMEHRGQYKCSASNKAGTDSMIIDIEITDMKSMLWQIFLYYILPALAFFLMAAVFIYWRYVLRYQRRIKKLKESGLEYFEKGKMECINPDIDMAQQADHLPYERLKWEFPREKLKLGKQLGSGDFGIVLKAEAYDLVEPGVSTTVAVKMVKRNSDKTTIQALASELKIMTYLADTRKHINVANVLGACTGYIHKRELLVLVEYCRYGSLREYLLKHRCVFINQVNPQTGQFDPTFIDQMSLNSTRNKFTVSNGEPDYGGYMDAGLTPVCTQDLMCWSFQIARGMEYLASMKVLHGDLAARNILLADDNIVKICDFGLAKDMYKYGDYSKKRDVRLPVNWLAPESLETQVFSTQSDVWSYGITLWELFSLSCTPYPGMEVTEVFTKLLQGFRMKKPKFATQEVYQVMMDCWHKDPRSRPSFSELSKRMRDMFEDSVREDKQFPARQDYVNLLQMSPYVDMNSRYMPMKPCPPRGGATELSPMLEPNAIESDTTEYVPMSSSDTETASRGNNRLSVTGFSNPSYINYRRSKKTPYENVPQA